MNKVHGGLTMVNGKQVRTIVASPSKKKAAELIGIPIGHFNDHFSVTGNEIELSKALANPLTVLVSSESMSYDFVARES